MRLKLALLGGPEVLVTTDATSTVADIARHLVDADPRRVAAVVGDLGEGGVTGAIAVTLRCTAPGETASRLLNPLLAVHESPLRSGCTVEVVSPDDRRPGDAALLTPVASLRVLGGPDAGHELRLVAGVNHIGRDAAAQVRLNDPSVSRRHASITVGENVVIADLNSSTGVRVDGEHVERAIVTGSSTIRLGDSTLRLVPLAVPGPPRAREPFVARLPTPPGVTADDTPFSRSPRLEPAHEGLRVTAPALPTVPERPRFPMIAVISPVIMGAVLFVVTQQVMSLLFIALSPLIMLGTYIDNRVQGRRRGRDDRTRFDAAMDSTRGQLERAREAEREARLGESPSTDQIREAVASRSPMLWTRKPEHSTFLEVRLGCGEQPSRARVVLPNVNSSKPDDWEAVAQLATDFATIDEVPVVERFDRAGTIGIAGDSILADEAARGLLLQLVGLHSPADLVVTALASGASAQRWSWLTWLPHVDSAYNPLGVTGLAADHSEGLLLIAQLEELVASRLASGAGPSSTVRSHLADDGSQDAHHGRPVDHLPRLPAVVVVATPEIPVDRARLVSLAEQGPDVGVFVLWIATSVAALPVACRTYLEIDSASGRGTVGFVRTGSAVPLSSLELADAAQTDATARLLAPLDDNGAPVLDESDLPHRVDFVDLFDEAVADDPGAVLLRWQKNDSIVSAWSRGTRREPGGLRGLVGQGPSDAFHLDLRRHGPHALVGGTTGSGKSEFLQTWLLGLATEYAPDRVTFLLVDYKGGAAFADCVSLPHTVGLVTDLTKPLVRRALTSLRAEVTRREHLLHAKGAKDLESLERRGDPDAPPSLLIVVDEFAALARDVPEFVDGVLDVAQRGRSLGLHLVLATQRPAGVISDNLRANTNLRLALRMADESDSQDVIGIPDAALFDPGTPGRAAAKLGPGRVLDFQTAYLGGVSTTTRRADVEVRELVFGGGAEWIMPEQGRTSDAGAARDIERLVATLSSAADRARLEVPRRPWLPELPAVVDLDELPVAEAAGSTGSSGSSGLPGSSGSPGSPGSLVTLALGDDPANQSQRPCGLPLDETGAVAVLGSATSGRTTVLRTLAVAVSRVALEHPVRIYALDFSGGALSSLESLPTVGSCIDGEDDERITRLFRDLARLIDERSALFAEARASSLGEFRALTGQTPPRVILLLDGMDAFRTAYEFRSGSTVFDTFTKLVTTGRQVGLHFAITADRLGAFPTSLQAHLAERIVLRLTSESEYSIAGVPNDILVQAPPGRALWGGLEVQFATWGGTADPAEQASHVDRLATQLTDVTRTPPIQRLPRVVALASLPATVDALPVLGLADDTLAPIGFPLEGLFVISGPFASGRTTATTTVTRGVRASQPTWQAHLIATRPGPLGAVTEWTSRAEDPAAADSLATELAERFESPRTPDDLLAFVVVPGVGDLEGLPADRAVARLLKAARRAGVVVVAETDTVTGAGAWQTHAELRSARAGLLLQPEEHDGSLLRAQLPRVTRADFPVGRGFLVIDGRATCVQVATTDVELSTGVA
jgi:S-DNA-T family DNA segregation ATPase FtsK/SpoIIIE